MTAVPVGIVVPVYRDVDDVRRCLESVVRHAAAMRTQAELVVIDDASPEPAVRTYLDRFADEPAPLPVTVLRNEKNLGFVGTMNRGLRATRGDVVMLNADTVVTAGWLDRLAEIARGTDVATVTPVTNHGSICTLPESLIAAFALDSPEPLVDECGAFVRSHSLGLTPEVITGVGFCMYTTRAAIDRGGPLDEEAFGRGYGEEVDFCLRVTRMGMRHLIDDSTFVYHRGGGSFGAEQAEGWARSAAVIHERYPYFRPTNQRERAEEPSRIAFTALDLARHERDRSRPHVLHVLHSRPGDRGGTEKFVEALTAALDSDVDFCTAYPVANGLVVRTHWRIPGTVGPVHDEFLLPGGVSSVTRVSDPAMGAAFAMTLDLFDFDAVHIHNLIGYSLAPLAALRGFPGPVVCSVHDLYLACPNFSLLYKRVESCGIPTDRDSCAACLGEIARQPMPGSPMIPELGLGYLDDHRAAVLADLDVVDHWVFAGTSVADTFARVYTPEPSRVHLIEHGSVIALGRRGAGPDPGLVHDEPLRIAFVGLGWSKKGLDVVNHLADSVADRSIEIHHFGELKEPASPFLRSHGPYDNSVLPELLRRAGIQIVLLPGPYAETFGIVMTEALAAGIPVIGARYGALGERIRAHGAGWTFDPLEPDELVTLVDRLDRARDEVMRATERVYRVRLHTVADTADRYGALYRAAPA